jgi:hypothetical protein
MRLICNLSLSYSSGSSEISTFHVKKRLEVVKASISLISHRFKGLADLSLIYSASQLNLENIRISCWIKLTVILCSYLNLKTYITLTLYPRRGSRGISDIFSLTPTFYQNCSAMRNTGDSGEPIAVWSQSISGVNAVIPLVALKREVLFLYSFRTPYVI